ncbi:MAG: Cj0069 family protein [Chromatiales bacterium]|nr:Cj0069 family protein [Chromatiales bacterium]
MGGSVEPGPSRRPPRVAIVYPGDRRVRDQATRESNRFADLARALADRGLGPEPAVYHDDLRDEVLAQLLEVDAALVWVNPIEGGRDRSVLDALLREVAAAGVYVSAHPDVVLAMGTKAVLYRTRTLGWGSDTRLYPDLADLAGALPSLLDAGQTRVLKQVRGNGGDGVWQVARAADARDSSVTLRHAKRGCVQETVSWQAFLSRMEPYFRGGGCIVDQPYQHRLAEGMARCYLVHDRIAGFGWQAVNALYPAPPGAPPEAAPPPGPRIYHPPTMAELQGLRRRVEDAWVPEMQALLGIEREDLPVIWDCDFLLGPRDASGDDTWVLCEINVSSVAPFPDSAVAPMVDAVASRLGRR